MAERILNDLGHHDGELSIVLLDDDDIRHLNRDYLSRDYPTNVLSFPMGEGDLMGDVVISTETAQREAKESGITLEEELGILLVHGILHLLGYDHEGVPEDAARMERKEQEVLVRLGFEGAGLVRR
jgi:probable rRNA maturation factor